MNSIFWINVAGVIACSLILLATKPRRECSATVGATALLIKCRFPPGRILAGFVGVIVTINLAFLVSLVNYDKWINQGRPWHETLMSPLAAVVVVIVAAVLCLPSGYWKRWDDPTRVTCLERCCDCAVGVNLLFWGLCHLTVFFF